MPDAKIEKSAMAVVMCQGKILATNEMIYGKDTLSLPKGHIEENETALEAAIRECYEETDIQLHESDMMKVLSPYAYEFHTPSNLLIRKTLFPFFFVIHHFGNPKPKEERMLSVQWMNVEAFLSSCTHENVRNIVRQVCSHPCQSL